MTDVDDELARLLRGAVATLEPPRTLDARAILARGRRLRRRRTTAQLGSALAVAGLAAGVAVAVASSATGPGRSDTVPAALGSTEAATTAESVPTVTMTPQLLVRTAIDLLPRPGTTSRYYGHPAQGNSVGAQFVWNDGHGAAEILLDLYWPASGADLKDSVQLDQPCDPGQPVDGGSCTVLADGAHAMVAEAPEYPWDHQPYNALDRRVQLVRTDGVEVNIEEWNSSQEKDAPITRAQPPLTDAELIAMADSARWQPQVAKSSVAAAAGLFTPDPLPTVPAGQSASASCRALALKQPAAGKRCEQALQALQEKAGGSH